MTRRRDWQRTAVTWQTPVRSNSGGGSSGGSRRSPKAGCSISRQGSSLYRVIDASAGAAAAAADSDTAGVVLMSRCVCGSRSVMQGCHATLYACAAQHASSYVLMDQASIGWAPSAHKLLLLAEVTETQCPLLRFGCFESAVGPALHCFCVSLMGDVLLWAAYARLGSWPSCDAEGGAQTCRACRLRGFPCNSTGSTLHSPRASFTC
jgi:hypothetical protein